MTGPNLKHLVERARSWYLARVVGVYVLASSAVLQGIDLLESQFGLPSWIFPASLILLLIGLPLVIATAVLQRRVSAAAGSGADAAGGPTSESAAQGFSRLLTWRLAILGGVLAFLVLGSIGASLVWLRNRGTELSPDAVAVLPFHVVGTDEDLWREGLVDLLGTALDATGELRSSDPRAVLNRWHRTTTNAQELPEPANAAEVARSLGAGRMILGSLIRIAPNSVRLAADLYSVRWLRKEATAVVEGAEDEMTALVDRLTIDLLRSVWEGDSIPDVRVSAMTTSSIPALRAYLEGEQAFRQLRFADAQAAYTRAIEQDSTFAIAHYRLAQTFGWFVGLVAPEVPRYLAAAQRHSDGLSARDSLLIRAWKLADVDGDLDAIPIFENLVARYADDLEAWHGLGDALFHMGSQANRPITAAVEPLERTLALDSAFAPSLIHLIEIAYMLDDAERGRRWTEHFLALDSSSVYAQSFRLLTPLQFGPSRDSARADAALDTVNAELLHWMIARLRGSGSNLPLFERVTLELADSRFPNDERAMGYYHLAEAQLRYGRVAIAVDLLRQVSLLSDGEMNVPALRMIARAREVGIAVDTASYSLIERLAATVDHPVPALAVLSVREGQPDAVAEAAVEWLEGGADEYKQQGRPEFGESVRGQALTLQGRIAAANDSAEAAISLLRRGLEMMNATWGRVRDLDRYWLASLLQENGGEEEALAIFGSLYWHPWVEPLGLYQRAQLHEHRGEFDQAARYYARFLELWDQADPHLQPRVEAARLALQRLRGESIAS
jgi:tetratricopeptide (TPR) repeat protein